LPKLNSARPDLEFFVILSGAKRQSKDAQTSPGHDQSP
jgi:hypothetical protein